MDWKLWIGIGWIACGLAYMSKAEAEYENSPHLTDKEKEIESLKFWGKVFISPLLLITGKW